MEVKKKNIDKICLNLENKKILQDFQITKEENLQFMNKNHQSTNKEVNNIISSPLSSERYKFIKID